MALRGSPELRARLRAIRLSFKPAGKAWADEVVKIARPMVPVKTGKLRKSIRRTHATQKKATVGMWYTGFFIDSGTKAHAITPRRKKALAWQSGGRTIFSKKVNHPRTSARPFRKHAAREALRRKPLAGEIVRQWNEAA